MNPHEVAGNQLRTVYRPMGDLPAQVAIFVGFKT
jgi:hypothetical protein